MAFDPTASLQAIQSHLAASGRCSSTEIGEPRTPPEGDGMHGAVFVQSIDLNSLYLDGGTNDVWSVLARLHLKAFNLPQSNSEAQLGKAASEIMEDLAEDFTLGGSVREIDIAGIRGDPMRAEWGHVEIGGVIFRAVDIFIPMAVDDSATAAA